MEFNSNVIDIWCFHRDEKGEAKYLLLKISQEKADRYFNGGVFWHVPSGMLQEEDTAREGIVQAMGKLDLIPTAIWAIEHAYTIYNRRFNEVQVVTTFAIEVKESIQVDTGDEHSECGWFSAEECIERLNFRGQKEGLRWLREYITENENPHLELSLIHI